MRRTAKDRQGREVTRAIHRLFWEANRQDKGKIVQIGTHGQLLANKKGIYARLWAHQSGGYVGISAAKSSTEEK